MQLSSNGVPIGTEVDVLSMASGDDVIDFDDDVIMIDDGDTQESDDSVIHF